MTNPFVLKLRHGAPLTSPDEEVLASLAQRTRSLGARRDLVKEGSEQQSLPLILDGWACRYRDLPNGKRQITTLYLPGDLCEPFGVLPRFMDGVGALTPVVFAPVSVQAIEAAAKGSAGIEEALWWDLLVASSIEREHLVSLGRRSASERIGHFFCEINLRLDMIGLVDGLEFDLPITQTDLSDLLGLTAVHVNRSLKSLRESGLISFRGRRLRIHDLRELREHSFFDGSYLHVNESMRNEILNPLSASKGNAYVASR